MALTALSALESVTGTRYTKRAQRLIAEASTIADRLGDPWTKGTHSARQTASTSRQRATGRKESNGSTPQSQPSRPAVACAGKSKQLTRFAMTRSTGWANGTSSRASCLCGWPKPSSAETNTLSTMSFMRFSPILRMAADQLDEAMKDFEQGLRLLPDGAFQLPHRLAVSSGIDLDLYGRHPSAADERLTEAWPRLAPMCRVWQNGRIEMLFYRVRIALALAAQAKSDTVRREALQRAEADCRALERDAPWAYVLAQLARATLSHANGRTQAAVGELEAAAQALREPPHEPLCGSGRLPARHAHRRRQGTELVENASVWMGAHHMANAARIAALLAPGLWDNEGTRAVTYRHLQACAIVSVGRGSPGRTNARDYRRSSCHCGRRIRPAPSGCAYCVGARGHWPRTRGSDRTGWPRDGVRTRRRPLHDARRARRVPAGDARRRHDRGGHHRSKCA